MLFISDIARTLLKMVSIRLKVHAQRDTKVFRYITFNEENFSKNVLTYLSCTKYKEINICHLMYKSMFSIKNGINRINILYAGLYKRIPTYCSQLMQKFKNAF